jgi:hypothetical protein
MLMQDQQKAQGPAAACHPAADPPHHLLLPRHASPQRCCRVLLLHPSCRRCCHLQQRRFPPAWLLLHRGLQPGLSRLLQLLQLLLLGSTGCH